MVKHVSLNKKKTFTMYIAADGYDLWGKVFMYNAL